MSDFDARLFMPVFSDGQHFNVFDAKFKDLRFRLPIAQKVTVDAKLEGNLPLIAHLYLGDQKLWWILLQFNGLLDGIKDVYAGRTLNVPDRNALIALLQATEDQQTNLVL